VTTMIYDINNISYSTATKYWSVYPYTFRIYETECAGEEYPINYGTAKLNGSTPRDRWNMFQKNRLGNYCHIDAMSGMALMATDPEYASTQTPGYGVFRGFIKN